MRNLVKYVVGLTALAAALPAQAVVIYYQQGFTNNLYKYDSATATEILVGNMGLNNDSTGMAFAANGTLYAHERASRSLYTINTITGAATLVGSTGLDAEDLTISLDGTKGYVTSSGGLYSINLATGAATIIGGGSIFDGLTTARVAGSLAGNAYAAGDLFAVDSGGIYSVNALTGASTFLGATTGADETLDFGSDGVLYGHGDDGALYTIDAVTLVATQFAVTTPRLVFGMAVEPTDAAVPEPATWALLIVGFGALGVGLRRKKATTTVSFA